jgi:hypothetical protein
VTSVPRQAASDEASTASSASPGGEGSSDAAPEVPGVADSSAQAAPRACTSPLTCPADPALEPGLDRPETAARCCVDDLCSYTPPASCADVKDLAIAVSSYDESCSVDSDCTTAANVSACYGPQACDYGPIAMTALSQYESDVAMLPMAPCVLPVINCPPIVPGPCGLCCRSGACQVGDACCGAGED